MDADLKTTGHQCINTLFNHNQNVKCKCATEASQVVWCPASSALTAIAVSRLSRQTAVPQRPYRLFQTLYFHDKPPKQTLWRVKTPCKHFTRSQIHGHTYRPQALELLLQNKLQDVTDARYHNSINFTVTQQNCTQQKVAVKLTAENVLLFFKLGENRKNKTRNMHTLKSIQKL